MRAISRLIDSPSPVPPYWRLVEPSACWKASKMIRCLSAGCRCPVSRDREGDHRLRVVQVSLLRAPAELAEADAELTLPFSVNLKAFESRFLSTCCSRRASVRMAAGSSADWSISKVEALGHRHLAEGALDEAAHVGELHLVDVDVHRARLDLRQIEDVVDQLEQIAARGMDRLGVLDLLGTEVPVAFSASMRDRMSRLLSGVRSSWDMLARNCDL
jgi:hypothetical protein